MRLKNPVMQTKSFLALQAVALAAGNYVGWTTIAKEVKLYCDQFDGSLWRLTDFSGNLTDNPLTTPCFWGSIAFVVTFLWTMWLVFVKDAHRIKAHVKRLWWLLLGGTIFALVNNVPIFYDFYTKPEGAVGCSAGGFVTNPFATSCFLGFSAFLAAFVFASIAKRIASRTEPTV